MPYAPNTVRALLETNLITDATRQALTERLNAPPRRPSFFSATEFGCLKSVCDRLIPPDDLDESIDVAGGIDKRLAENRANGWRYDIMPPDADAYRLGLAGVEESAQTLFQQSFQQLSAQQQDQVLGLIQTGHAPGATWLTLPASRFFEELLAEAVENYYSHPLAQEKIGYVGMADVPGWQRIELNELEDREQNR